MATVIVVVDRVELDTQISGTFNAADVPNTVPVGSTAELDRLIKNDTRKILITTIFKFAELPPETVNPRQNIIVLVDEAHRTQEGNLGMKMRGTLPNAFFFGLTGTPINKADRNTFWTFGAEEDTGGCHEPLHAARRHPRRGNAAAALRGAVDRAARRSDGWN